MVPLLRSEGPNPSLNPASAVLLLFFSFFNGLLCLKIIIFYRTYNLFMTPLRILNEISGSINTLGQFQRLFFLRFYGFASLRSVWAILAEYF